jgi:hypothetical protein
MKAKLTAVLLLLGTLIVGIILGYTATSIKNWFIPSDHAQLANAITVYDATYGRLQTLYFERAGRSQLLSITPLWTYQNREYQYSFWTFRYGDDINAVMLIWGPDEYGNYYIEIAKLAGNQIDVTWPDGSKTTDILYAGWNSP